jgi:23S rRNA (uracil1939-C5)-methyltransferase
VSLPRTLLDVDIESVSADGDGIARVGRRRYAVPFTIPGERVRIAVPEHRPDAPATLVAVLRGSPQRVTPRCPHFGVDAEPGVGPCGGCTWQHIAYPEQLRLKTALVDRLVREAVPQAPRASPMIPSTPMDDPWGYRHKVHFVFGHGADARAGAGAVMGHYVRGSRRVVPVRECPVHDPRGNALAFRFRDAFAGLAGRGRARPSPDTLRGLAIRVGARTPEIVATLVVTSDEDKQVRAATRRAIGAGDPPTAFHVNLHPRRDGLIFGRETRRIAGPARMRESAGGVTFLISPTAFFQTNIYAADILVRLVLADVPAGAGVLDLYAGAGLFALPLARAGHPVIAVEENRTAVGDGEASLRLNRIPPERCRFVGRPVETALGTLFPRGTRQRSAERPDVAVLDPPREGCAPSVLHELFGQVRPARAIYVSCNPDALARDLRTITAHGYSVRSLQPVDMFPHTAHVETVVVLDREK